MSSFGTGSQIGPAGELSAAEEALVAVFTSLSVTDNNFIVANGSTWITESGATARASLGISDDGGIGTPSSSTDNAIVRWNGLGGDTLQDYTSGAPTISDTGEMTVPSGITLDINFSSFNLTVKSGSGVLIKSGGTIT